jgi:hypothetical protein
MDWLDRLRTFVADLEREAEATDAVTEATDIAEPYLGTTLLTEGRAVREDGTVRLKVIGPGWGSSGYYSPELLERSAHVFAGTKMYWNHPTRTEARERPERDLRDLAAQIVGTPTYQANGPGGPGVYAEAKVFEPYRRSVADLAPHIGVSIRADGTYRPGEAAGRKGRVIEAIEKARSVDFVTEPGAGGRILELFEAAGRETQAQEDGMTQEQIDQIVAALNARMESFETRISQVNEALVRVTETLTESRRTEIARGVVARHLSGYRMTEAVRTRLTEALVGRVALDDAGTVDDEAFGAIVSEAVAAEQRYLAEATDGRFRIAGMASTTTATAAPAPEDRDKRLQGAFERLGMSEAARAVAVRR